MKTVIRHIVQILVLTTSVVSVASAQANLTKDELKNRKSALTSQGTHRRLSRAHELMAKDKLDDAIEILKRLETSTAQRPHEQAQVLQTLGFAYAQKDKLSEGLKYLQKSLDLGVLPYAPTLSTIYTIAQIHVGAERYAEATKQLDLWFRLADEPSADAYALKAIILAQQQKNKEALELVTKAIDMSKEPKESWLAFAVAMNYQLERYQEASRLLEMLANNYPDKKKYWKQLAGVYLNMEKNPKAMATLELAQKANYLDKDSEVMNLVSLLIYGGIPLKGARLLEENLQAGKVKKTQKNYEILGDAWFAAEEMDKALEAYAASAKLATDGRIFAKQGRIYLEQEKWKPAAEYLKNGLAKGGIKNPHHVYMALGVAEFNLKRFDTAIATFETAKKKSEQVEQAANQWIGFVKAEDARLNPEKYAKKASDDDDEEEDEGATTTNTTL